MGLWGQRKNLRLFKRRLLAEGVLKPKFRKLKWGTTTKLHYV